MGHGGDEADRWMEGFSETPHRWRKYILGYVENNVFTSSVTTKSVFEVPPRLVLMEMTLKTLENQRKYGYFITALLLI